MPFFQRRPAPPLSDFVELLWLQESSGSPQKQGRERLLPTGTSELVISLRDDPLRVYARDGLACESFRGGVLCGPHSNYFVIDNSEEASVAGVHFKPGGVAAFLGMPTDEVHNRHAGIDALWGSRSAELRDRLPAAPTPEAKFCVMESWLLSIGRGRWERNPVVTFAVREFAGGPRSVAEVNDRTGFSARRFVDIFRSEVGVTPKLFSRILRFQEALKKIDGDDIDWQEIALGCGYFDQAHFIHDFRAFSGINPSTYLRRRTPHMNHVPMDEGEPR